MGEEALGDEDHTPPLHSRQVQHAKVVGEPHKPVAEYKVRPRILHRLALLHDGQVYESYNPLEDQQLERIRTSRRVDEVRQRKLGSTLGEGLVRKSPHLGAAGGFSFDKSALDVGLDHEDCAHGTAQVETPF